MQADWQTTTILPNGFHAQVDCNSGVERTVQHATCNCGERVLIERNARYSGRRDQKRIFYADSADNLCAFRCRGCLDPLHISVDGADFDTQPNP